MQQTTDGPKAVLMNRGDYLASLNPVAYSPMGHVVYAWQVQDMSDLEQRGVPFARGRAIGLGLATAEAAQASRERMESTR